MHAPTAWWFWLEIVWCPGNIGGKSLHLGEDRLRGGGPNEGRGLGVLLLHEAIDSPDQFPHAREGAAADGFTSLAHAQAVIKAWRREYNEERPKKDLGGLTPAHYPKQLMANGSTVTVGL